MNGNKFVLVVEDDDEIRSLIVSSLKAESADAPLMIVEARDGREAIQIAGRQEFNCVVTDLNMPHTSGQELLRLLLSDSMNANTPTVVVSAGADEQFLAEFQNVRAMTKPFDPSALTQLILREIKLGRMDERVPIHLLNPFCEAMRNLMTDDMLIAKQSIGIISPTVRRSGEVVEGDLFAAVTLTTGMMQSRIAFAFDRTFLLQMKQLYFATRREQWATMNLELLVRGAVTAMLEKAAPAMTAVFGQHPRAAEITVLDLTDHLKSAEIIRTPGISVALSTDQGRVFVLALAPARAKRGVA